MLYSLTYIPSTKLVYNVIILVSQFEQTDNKLACARQQEENLFIANFEGYIQGTYSFRVLSLLRKTVGLNQSPKSILSCIDSCCELASRVGLV